MRHVSLKAALACGAMIGLSAIARGQVVNGNWEDPANAAGGTDTAVTGWTMDPTVQVGGAAGNPGMRCTFFGSADGVGDWSFWLQTFEATGDAFQNVGSVTAGQTYTFTSEMFFQLGPSSNPPGSNAGYNAVPGLNSYLGIQFLNSHGATLGSPTLTNIPAGTIVNNSTWDPYSVTATAPVGAASAEIIIGWTGGGSDNNTGSQSAGADDATFGLAPEPASLSLLGIGALGLLARRRTA